MSGLFEGTDAYTVLTVLGLTVVTIVSRAFFFISERSPTLPEWVERGLRYAPIAALSAVVIPEIVMTNGHLIDTWRDARLFAAVAGVGYFFLVKKGVLGVIFAGLAVYLPLHLGLGW